MDTNYLLKREQMSLMMAARSVSIEARHAHSELARGYGQMLAALRFPHRPFWPTPLENNDNENPDRGRSMNGRGSRGTEFDARPLHADRKYSSNLV